MSAVSSEGTILDTLAGSARLRVERAKALVSEEFIRDRALSVAKAPATFPFEKALSVKGVSFICEVKKASPSKGVIAADFPYMQIAKDYEAAGAAAVSVLTEPE